MDYSKGIDNSEIVESGPVKSIGQELTFLPQSTFEGVMSFMKPVFQQLHDRLSRDQQKHNRIGTSFVIKWAVGDYWSKFSSSSGKHNFNVVYGCSADDIAHVAMQVLKQQVKPPFKITRVAMSITNFESLLPSPLNQPHKQLASSSSSSIITNTIDRYFTKSPDQKKRTVSTTTSASSPIPSLGEPPASKRRQVMNLSSSFNVQ